MKIVLSARGSRGDVYPVLAIAAALRARGHHVLACVPTFFLPKARSLGLDVCEYHEDTAAIMRGFGAGWRASHQALRWFAESIEEEFDILLEQSRGADALVTTAAEVPPTTVAEHRRIPHYRVGYAPILPGDQPPPLQPYQRLPAFANRALWRALNATIKLLFGTQLNRWRVRLGLSTVGELGGHLARRSHTLLAISPKLAPPSPDWPRRGYRHHYLGYCFLDESDALPAEVEQFLEAGPPPVYVGFGSVHVPDPESITRALVDAGLRAGCRLLLGSGWTGLGQGTRLPPQMLVVGEVPHALLFPRLAAAIHHAGSGTVHNAARFGLPQLGVPQIADQFYWGHRLQQLGLGPRPLRPEQLSPRRLASALRALTRLGEERRRAGALGAAMAGEPGVSAAVALIESGGASTELRSTSVMIGPRCSHSPSVPEPESSIL